MRTLFVFCAIFFFITGCATERYVVPKISTQPRIGISLKTPILVSIYDGRTSGGNQESVNILKNELSRIYGKNFEWISYFDETPNGRIAVKFRIVELGSSFGSRLISSVSFENAMQSVKLSAYGPFGSVVGSASGSSSTFGSSFSGEGWWIGAAWVDVEIQDSRAGNYRFKVPIAAEHKESNMWGYSSGDKAARKAWEKVSAQITRAVDEILIIVRNSES